MGDEDKLVISEEAAAQMLGLSPRTLQRWRCQGRGPRFTKLGKRVAYSPAALRTYVEAAQRTSTGAEAA